MTVGKSFKTVYWKTDCLALFNAKEILLPGGSNLFFLCFFYFQISQSQLGKEKKSCISPEKLEIENSLTLKRLATQNDMYQANGKKEI